MSGDLPADRLQLGLLEDTPYVVRKVIEDIPLQADDESEHGYITCVEFWSR